jgi:hypothetical protein
MTMNYEEILVPLRNACPQAVIRHEPVNQTYGSWLISVEQGKHRLEIFWGPLSGFGATDLNHWDEDTNPFAPYDHPRTSATDAVEFVRCVLGT